MKYCLISLGGVIIAIFSGKKYGLTGVAFALAVYAVAMNIIGHIMVKRIICLGLRKYGKALVPAVIASGVMAGGMLILMWIQVNIIALPNLWFVLQSIVAGAVFYAYSLFVFNRQTYREMIELAHKLTRRGE